MPDTTHFDCAQCDKPFAIGLDSEGVANHTDGDRWNGIDHDADADHVPYVAEDDDDDLGDIGDEKALTCSKRCDFD
jgi:hypothetical protein